MSVHYEPDRRRYPAAPAGRRQGNEADDSTRKPRRWRSTPAGTSRRRVVQRTAGLVAEPLLARPGRQGVIALAEGAGLLVVGLSERWRHEGPGRVRSELIDAPPAPTVLVRRGPRPGGLAPPETATRFGWSLTASAS